LIHKAPPPPPKPAVTPNSYTQELPPATPTKPVELEPSVPTETVNEVKNEYSTLSTEDPKPSPIYGDKIECVQPEVEKNSEEETDQATKKQI